MKKENTNIFTSELDIKLKSNESSIFYEYL